MAIPWDPTQHIQGIASGLKDAMPGIMDAMPGDENIDKYLNEYTARRQSGEPKESIIADLSAKLQREIGAQPNVNPGTPRTVGVNAGSPALGQPGQLAAPISQPSQGSFTPQQQPTAQPAPTQQPGLQAAATPTPFSMMGGAFINKPSGINAIASEPPTTESPVNVPSGIDARGGGFGDNTITGVNPEDAAAMDAERKRLAGSKIDLTAGRNTMQTATTPAPQAPTEPPKRRSRGEQREAMQNIMAIESIENKRDTLDLKAAKLEQDEQLKTLDKLIKINKNDKDFALGFEKLRNSIKGMDVKQQQFVVKMWIEAEQNKMKNRLGAERNRIYGRAVDKAPNGADKIPPQLLEAGRRYSEVRSKLYQLKSSGMDRGNNAAEVAQLQADETRWRDAYNKLAKGYGWNAIDANGTLPEPPPEFIPKPEPKGFWDSFFSSDADPTDG